MLNRTLVRRLNQLEARLPGPTKLEDFHTILFFDAKDETPSLTLQFGPNGSQTFTDLTDPANPRIWTRP